MFTPSIMGSGLVGYTFLARTRADQQAAMARTPAIAREASAFVAGLKDVQTVDQLMENRTLLKVALGAFGLGEDIDNRAFIRKVLSSDLADEGSLANRLADKRYLAFARAFAFGGSGTPALAGLTPADSVADDLAAVRTVDDLMADPALLRATLQSFGLEKDIGNTYFLRQVLGSDPADPASFAARLSDPRYAELAAAFGLADKQREAAGIRGFADAFADAAEGLKTADDLFAAPDLLQRALRIFGLPDAPEDTDFLRGVLESDLDDPASPANAQEDPRYAALARVFGFAERAAAEAAGEVFTSRLESFVAKMSERDTGFTRPKDLLDDIGLSLAVFDFFDLPVGSESFAFAHRVLASDRDSPTSLANVHPDPRVKAFADAFVFPPTETRRVYPPGFAEKVVQSYLDREFEARVGETDPALRIALSLPRDLAQVIDSGGGANSRWFGVMASRPLRAVFEAVFNLPESFGTLEIDRQLGVFRARAEAMFGTSDLAELAGPDHIEDIRRRYLVQSSLAQSKAALVGSGTGGSVVSALLAGAIR